jgi:predicted transcriptional regulator
MKLISQDLTPKCAKKLFRETGRDDRNRAIVAAHVRYGYTLSEIGRHLGIHYTTVSKIIKAGT